VSKSSGNSDQLTTLTIATGGGGYREGGEKQANLIFGRPNFFRGKMKIFDAKSWNPTVVSGAPREIRIILVERGGDGGNENTFAAVLHSFASARRGKREKGN